MSSRRILVVWMFFDHRLGIRYSLIHENRRELHPFDVSPVPTCLPPAADKPSEGFAVRFGISSIALGIDPTIIARRTPGSETGTWQGFIP